MRTAPWTMIIHMSTTRIISTSMKDGRVLSRTGILTGTDRLVMFTLSWSTIITQAGQGG